MKRMLADVRPELINEWSQRNLPLMPDSVTHDSLQDIVENGLDGMEFDDLIYVSDEELAPFYEKHDELDDVDPAVIRQQLEDAGIVNGELVDEPSR